MAEPPEHDHGEEGEHPVHGHDDVQAVPEPRSRVDGLGRPHHPVDDPWLPADLGRRPATTLLGMATSKRPTSWANMNLTGARLGVYSRASKDAGATESSVDAQDGVGERWGKRNGCVIVRYSDNEKPASRYGTKVRDEFEKLVLDIE